jgi:hypothetical protein
MWFERIKESKAAGPDKINAKLVKDSAEVICPTLTKFSTDPCKQGIFPEELKTAFVSPIYKNGEKSDCIAIIGLFRFCRLLQKF